MCTTIDRSLYTNAIYMLVLGSLLQRCRLCKFASVCIGECTTLERPNFLGPHDTRLAYRFVGSWVVEDSVRES